MNIKAVKSNSIFAIKGEKLGVVKLINGASTLEITGNSKKKTISIPIPEKGFTSRRLIILARRLTFLAKAHNIEGLIIHLDEFRPSEAGEERELVESIVTNILLGNYEFNTYKTKKKDIKKIETLYIGVSSVTKEIKEGIARAIIIAGEVNDSRDLANTPGGEMTPEILAQRIQKSAKGSKVNVKVLDEKDMELLGMGAILGVSKGSETEAKFIILEYFGADKVGKEKPIVLVGKGITFDTGGLSLKSSKAMYEMHLDMSGGAAVAHTVIAAAKLGVQKNIIALIPAVENMPGSAALRPGDVLKSMSGKTIEVIDTDAEGRLVLADALTYAKRYKPETVIDVATLTGASMAALGQRTSALMTKNKELSDELMQAGEKTGDFVWPLPLWDEYDIEIKGVFGDVANLGKTPYGGAITAGVFLKQFAGSFKRWAHIDIAPRMTSIDGDFLSKGSVGAPILMLLEFLRS